MWISRPAALAVCLVVAAPGLAATYALSADGAAVVRLTPQGTVGAGSLTMALPGGYTVTAGNAGSISTTAYEAGFVGGSGGAHYEALYSKATPLAAGQSINWVQVVSTNVPRSGATSPYLDNAKNQSQPFYDYTAENKQPGLPANQLNFYDYSRRPAATLSATNPITWDAKLYPVLVDGNTLTVQNGTEWGWTMKKATVGKASATFSAPTPGSAVTSGVGTGSFAWGVGEPSSLSFAGASFDTSPGAKFKLGTLTFHNGTIYGNTGADSVKFDLSLAFDNVPEKNLTLSTSFGINNTPNSNNPVASADYVSIGDYGYTFNVLEGKTASVDLYGILSTGFSVMPSGTSADSAIVNGPFDPSPKYRLAFAGFGAPSSGGFTTGVPEPASWMTMTLAFALVGGTMRRRTGWRVASPSR